MFSAAQPLRMVLAGGAIERFGLEATHLALATVLAPTALLSLWTTVLREPF